MLAQVTIVTVRCSDLTFEVLSRFMKGVFVSGRCRNRWLYFIFFLFLLSNDFPQCGCFLIIMPLRTHSLLLNMPCQ